MRDSTKRKLRALEDAKAEAQRFLGKIDAAIEEVKDEDGYGRPTCYAAVRRSSMDLSSALVKVRYPDNV